jgi:hypothetical protein
MRTILEHAEPRTNNECPIELAIEYKDKKIQSKRHDYELLVRMTNKGTKPISDWHVDVECPTRLLEPQVRLLEVRERSDANRTFLRSTKETHQGVIYPGDTKLVMSLDYRIDDELYRSRGNLFDQLITATAYMGGTVAARTQRPVRELQNF